MRDLPSTAPMTVTREPDIRWGPPEDPVGPPPAPLHRRPGGGTGALVAVLVLALTLVTAGSAAGVWSLRPTAVTSSTGPSGTVGISGVPSRAVASVVDITSRLASGAGTTMGTGIVLSRSGIVLTNNHVIEGASSISVTDVGNGRTYDATVVGYDVADDLAVLRLSGASGLTTADLGDSDTAAVGQSVTGLGNAGGAGGTPSAASGTITALGVSISAQDNVTGTSEDLSGLIQTDAPIQAGDSGGPLLDSSGKVIGIDTAATPGYHFRFRAGATAAYAIPLNRALKVAARIRSGR